LNTAVGGSALAVNTTGAANVAVGYQALDANTTGDTNTAVGKAAMTTNTTGSRNTGIGLASLNANTTGSEGTAVGYVALYNNTTGPHNTAVGFAALYTNTTGQQNTAIGQNALLSATTANYNSVLGKNAGSSITTGASNTIIGYRAGVSGEALTTGARNTFIGANVHGQATGSESNAFGYDVAGSANTTTIGYGTSDIRTTHGSTNWATVSDERYKKDITSSTAGLSFVNALRPVTWNYKTLGELPETFNAYKADSTEVFKNTQTNHGFIAQEVKTVMDSHSEIKDGFQMWNSREDGSQEVADGALIPILTKAIQELSARIEVLEGE